MWLPAHKSVNASQILFQSGNYWLVDVGLVLNDYRVVYVDEIFTDEFGGMIEANCRDVCAVAVPTYGEYIAYSMSLQYPAI